MAEIRTELTGHVSPGRFGRPGDVPGVTFRELAERGVVQVAAWPRTFGLVADRIAALTGCPVPGDTRLARSGSGVTTFMTGPERLLIASADAAGLYGRLAQAFIADMAVVTDLSHARTVVRLGGPRVTDFLSRIVAIDVSPANFPLMSFAQTRVHTIGVLLHFAEIAGKEELFDLYIPRSYGLSHWHWLTHVAEPLGYEVLG